MIDSLLLTKVNELKQMIGASPNIGILAKLPLTIYFFKLMICNHFYRKIVYMPAHNIFV